MSLYMTMDEAMRDRDAGKFTGLLHEDYQFVSLTDPGRP